AVPAVGRRVRVRDAAALLPQGTQDRRAFAEGRGPCGDVIMENEPKSSPRLEPVPRDARPPEPTPPVDEPVKNRRRPFVLVGIVAAVLLTGIAGYMIWTHGEENTDDAQISADLVPIGTRVAGQVVKVHVLE